MSPAGLRCAWRFHRLPAARPRAHRARPQHRGLRTRGRHRPARRTAPPAARCLRRRRRSTRHVGRHRPRGRLRRSAARRAPLRPSLRAHRVHPRHPVFPALGRHPPKRRTAPPPAHRLRWRQRARRPSPQALWCRATAREARRPPRGRPRPPAVGGAPVLPHREARRARRRRSAPRPHGHRSSRGCPVCRATPPAEPPRPGRRRGRRPLPWCQECAARCPAGHGRSWRRHRRPTACRRPDRRDARRSCPRSPRRTERARLSRRHPANPPGTHRRAGHRSRRTEPVPRHRRTSPPAVGHPARPHPDRRDPQPHSGRRSAWSHHRVSPAIPPEARHRSPAPSNRAERGVRFPRWPASRPAARRPRAGRRSPGYLPCPVRRTGHRRHCRTRTAAVRRRGQPGQRWHRRQCRRARRTSWGAWPRRPGRSAPRTGRALRCRAPRSRGQPRCRRRPQAVGMRPDRAPCQARQRWPGAAMMSGPWPRSGPRPRGSLPGPPRWRRCGAMSAGPLGRSWRPVPAFPGRSSPCRAVVSLRRPARASPAARPGPWRRRWAPRRWRRGWPPRPASCRCVRSPSCPANRCAARHRWPRRAPRPPARHRWMRRRPASPPAAWRRRCARRPLRPSPRRPRPASGRLPRRARRRCRRRSAARPASSSAGGRSRGRTPAVRPDRPAAPAAPAASAACVASVASAVRRAGTTPRSHRGR
ncbi:hypothetical protein SXIM_38760 [Streptomyces xiamenensis]|uniref:Uncharacterized protein n=1 Tax=Streptomyces xiamenensis TaxID=408015 RepID=A0A0F7FXR8_9ACTN|nr:hypothetical protein SXIM_38760 [Streptomyces xiamenensis]